MEITTKEHFEEKILVHIPLLWRIAREHFPGSKEDQEDLVQEALRRAWEFRASMGKTGDNYYKAWVCRIIKNCAITIHRTPLSRRLVLMPHVYYSYRSMNIESQIIARFEWSYVESIISGFSDQKQSVFVMFYEGYSHKEISKTLEIPENRSKVTVCRARKKIVGHINAMNDYYFEEKALGI